MASMYDMDGKIMHAMDEGPGLDKFTVAPNKARKPNWTENEVVLLLEEYSKRRHLIKPKFGTVVSMTERQRCWCDIADVINTSEGINGCYRSVKEVQKKWENLNNRMRSEFSTIKVEPNFRLSETSVAINNILSGDGTFDPSIFAKGYRVMKLERPDDDEYVMKSEDSHISEESADDIHNTPRENVVPVLNIPFKANNRYQPSREPYVPVTPRSNQIYSSLADQSSASKYPRSVESQDEELTFPSGDSVYVTSPPVPNQTTTEQNGGVDSYASGKDRPNPETSAKLREAMLKRVNPVNNSCSLDSEPPNKKPKLDNLCSCSIFSDKSVTKLYKQVLTLKKRTLKQNLEKLDLEKEKLKLETEKLKLENEAAKMNKDKVFMEMVTLKQKFSALL